MSRTLRERCELSAGRGSFRSGGAGRAGPRKNDGSSSGAAADRSAAFGTGACGGTLDRARVLVDGRDSAAALAADVFGDAAGVRAAPAGEVETLLARLRVEAGAAGSATLVDGGASEVARGLRGEGGTTADGSGVRGLVVAAGA